MSEGDLKRYTERALRAAVAGTLAPVIGQTFPLEQSASAHAAIESRAAFGKTLLVTRLSSLTEFPGPALA